MMINIYKYMFYRLRKWQLKQYDADDGREYYAVGLVTFIILLNVLSFCLILDIFGLKNPLNAPKTIVLAIGFGILFLCNYLFADEKKFKMIEKEFRDESQKQKANRTLFIWIYIIASIAVNVILLYILSYFRNKV